MKYKNTMLIFWVGSLLAGGCSAKTESNTDNATEVKEENTQPNEQYIHEDTTPRETVEVKIDLPAPENTRETK